ncbi:MAG: acyl-CoA dehydrogenase family protein [Deltaproteobacteria bacterium]|nr:acyl-CoA dehydrogenase family protein [Deltaproteobacteria bacterium]
MADESFMKSLFGGVVAEGLIIPYPEASRAEADEVHAVLDGLRKLAPKIDSAKIDRDESIPSDVRAGLAELGAFGLVVPKAHGGAGMRATPYTRIVQEVAALDSAVALTLQAHESLGVAALNLFGSDDVKARFLPRLAKGEALAAFALAEVGAGSDAGSIHTRADLDGDDYVISGEKAWVTNGGVADILVVFARTSPADDGAKPRLTAFAVDVGPGMQGRLVRGANEPKLGVRGASTTSITFDRVRVPRANVLGEVGRGFKVAMEVLTMARLSLATSCLGSAKRLLKLSVDRIAERKTFGRNIGEFGLVRDKVAQMSSELFALESMAYLTTGLVDSGRCDFTVESAICKVFGSETLWRVANESQQVAAALGYTRALPWERLLRDARMAMVFEGTNEILRCFIALSGMQGPGLQLEEVSKAMREPIKGFGLLGEVALRKAKSALGRERLSRAHPVLAAESVCFEEYTSHLAKSVDKVLRRHGKMIAEMQYTQKRIADIAIDLYAIASVVSRTTRAIERRGEEGARREIDLASVFVASAKRRMADNIAAMDENDDELRKAIAQKTFSDGGYPLDVI